MTRMMVLSAQDAAKVFTMEDAITAVEDAYRQKATGKGVAWPMVYEQFEPGVADMDIRSGELAESGLFGLKLTAWFSKNPKQGLPDIFGTTLLCDNATGEPIALLNASAVTGLRTGAAAALGAKWLARADASRLFVAGSGHMSTYMVAGVLAACPKVREVKVWNPISDQAPEARVERMRAEVEEILGACEHPRAASSYSIAATADGEGSAAEADIIVTITPATKPVIDDAWVRPGTHISCVGADMPGKQELDSALVARAALYVDDRVQSVASGELEIPVAEGAIVPEDIKAELGEVIAGKAAGRTDDSQVTVFDTSGIAVQDLAASKIAYDRAVETGLGAVVEL